jgi:hypothetical protein
MLFDAVDTATTSKGFISGSNGTLSFLEKGGAMGCWREDLAF